MLALSMTVVTQTRARKAGRFLTFSRESPSTTSSPCRKEHRATRRSACDSQRDSQLHVKWLTPVVGAVFFRTAPLRTPFETPTLRQSSSGMSFHCFPRPRTAGWLSMELPVLVTHSPGTGSSGNIRDYGRDLVLLPTGYLHLGERALREFGSVWSLLKVFAQLEQVMTSKQEHRNRRT